MMEGVREQLKVSPENFREWMDLNGKRGRLEDARALLVHRGDDETAEAVARHERDLERQMKELEGPQE